MWCEWWKSGMLLSQWFQIFPKVLIKWKPFFSFLICEYFGPLIIKKHVSCSDWKIIFGNRELSVSPLGKIITIDFSSSSYTHLEWMLQSILINTVVPLCNYRPLADPSILNFVLTTRGNKCKFPFRSSNGHSWFRSCYKSQSMYFSGDILYRCETLSGKDESCSPKYKGKWSNWSAKKCNRPCGGGQEVFEN